MKDPLNLIYKVYNFSEHRSSEADNSISASQLLGPLYRTKLFLNGVAEDPGMIADKFKRSAMIGSAVHKRFEEALKYEDGIIQEEYTERQIELDGVTYTISGTFDLLEKNQDDTYTIMDIKTMYGRDRKEEQLAKDALQMSIYRWLNQDNYTIEDRAYVLVISQSYNYEDAIPVRLKSIDWVQNYIEEIIWSALRNTKCDCFDGVKYNPCNYCSILACAHRKGDNNAK